MEITYENESEARESRRMYIMSGSSVSLLAYDPNRDLYVFDVIT